MCEETKANSQTFVMMIIIWRRLCFPSLFSGEFLLRMDVFFTGIWLDGNLDSCRSWNGITLLYTNDFEILSWLVDSNRWLWRCPATGFLMTITPCLHAIHFDNMTWNDGTAWFHLELCPWQCMRSFITRLSSSWSCCTGYPWSCGYSLPRTSSFSMENKFPSPRDSFTRFYLDGFTYFATLTCTRYAFFFMLLLHSRLSSKDTHSRQQH